MAPDDLYKFDRSEALMARARKVIPGGIYGHKSPVLLVPGAYPSFMARGEGCRIWDVDGNAYIDFMCSYGPIVLGHKHPRVEEAAAAERSRGDSYNLPGEVWVELAELLVDITPAADWVMYAKNGSDVTTWSLAVARAHTRRNKAIMAAGAYHGSHAWCSPIPTGITDADRASTAATSPLLSSAPSGTMHFTTRRCPPQASTRECGSSATKRASSLSSTTYGEASAFTWVARASSSACGRTSSATARR
jgi:glutamate-1-semialdehyde aminotransferase